MLKVPYVWDPHKAVTNLRKHGVDFADAIFALTVTDDYPYEQRFVTMGLDALGRILVVVYTWRINDEIRIISARKATPSERRQYVESS